MQIKRNLFKQIYVKQKKKTQWLDNQKLFSFVVYIKKWKIVKHLKLYKNLNSRQKIIDKSIRILLISGAFILPVDVSCFTKKPHHVSLERGCKISYVFSAELFLPWNEIFSKWSLDHIKSQRFPWNLVEEGCGIAWTPLKCYTPVLWLPWKKFLSCHPVAHAIDAPPKIIIIVWTALATYWCQRCLKLSLWYSFDTFLTVNIYKK